MATGTDSLRGLYVPLNGNFTIKARVAATDIMTIEGAGSTGDYIVCRTSAAVEAFVVEDDGKIVNAAGAEIACLLAAAKALTVGTDLTVTAGDVLVTAGDVVITKGNFLRFTSWPITAVLSATAVTLGDLWLQKTSTYVQIAICESTSVYRYINTTSA